MTKQIEPTKCHLWQKQELTNDDLVNNFDLVTTCVDSSHLDRLLLKCKDCGQLYFSEFYEVVDFDEGNDSQYTTYIPVENEEEAKKISTLTPFELLEYTPRLQHDYKAGINTTKWIGKNS